MTNISEQVSVFLDNDFIIRKCLFSNILSLRALARHIIKTLELSEKNLDAAISAIRRYKRDHKAKEQARATKVFSNIGIKTKDNVVDIQLPKNRQVQDKLSRLNSQIDFEKGDILRIIQAEQGVRVFIDEKNLKSFMEIFSKKEIHSMDKNLAEIIIQFFPGAEKTLGIISVVSSSLTAGNISIHEIMSSAPELIILVKNEDIVKTLNILNSLKRIY